MCRLVAHRGQQATCPENTLESIRQAIHCGARAVEFDIQMSKDHIPVVCHDVNLRRTAGIDMDITQHCYDEMKDISVGEPSRYAEQYINVTLPTLGMMAKQLQATPEVLVFVELKDESIEAFGIDSYLGPVIEQLSLIRQQTIVIANNLQALLRLREQIDLAIGWIVHGMHEQDFALATHHNLDYLVINHKYCPGHYDFSSNRWKWFVYETRNPDKVVRLFEQGVAFVETNDICQLLQRLPGYK